MDCTRHHPLHTVARVKARLGLHEWDYLGTGVLAAEFRCWLNGIDRRLLSDISYVVSIRCSTVKRARASAGLDVAERREAWISWLHDRPAAGLGRQHRMSRVAHGWIPAPVAAVLDPLGAEFDEDDGTAPLGSRGL